jgi:hypothetical protein
MPQADRIDGNLVLRREWRQLVRLALESLGTGLFVSLILALAVFVISFEAKAATAVDTAQGTPLPRDADSGQMEATLLATGLMTAPHRSHMQEGV